MNQCFQKVQVESKEHKTMACPECKSQLMEKRDYGITINECEKCFGVFVNEKEIQKVSRHKRFRKGDEKWRR